ncbi:transcriptional regulator [Novosphingobium chloroacetimidivorans]|uniref:Transcriptional regulator n=1 Tax=Novosphingobium chloroacetimidivorans TaxID=1428314 RepID=A0A7W7NYJ7_9SPHN|nr:FMN-binding negative transcriptional regulator [Novosphingobium chloroacetimidivorans]MBB4860272.1 transcriptional regulator [Novosphingobium chloroacetimidivorans]
MHPDPHFQPDDRALCEALVEEVGFAMIFAATSQGPRVVHAPLVSTRDGAVQFHVSRRNAIAAHLDGATALCVVNGPDAYISPRWYSQAAQVPTWNYVSVELEGRVRRMDADGLHGQLEALTARHESRIAQGQPWTLDKTPAAVIEAMLKGIVGFELEVQQWRPTFKLSQNKPASERERVIAGLEEAGSPGVAQLMRSLAA